MNLVAILLFAPTDEVMNGLSSCDNSHLQCHKTLHFLTDSTGPLSWSLTTHSPAPGKI